MSNSPEIIAEAGSNHNGDPALACSLIDLAARAGASSVKFQFILADGLYLSEFFDGESYFDNPVYSQRKSEELTEADWFAIWDHARECGIPVAASVFCDEGLRLLQRLGAPYVKIASTDLTNHSLISRACATFNRVIVSTGMASVAEIDEMVQLVRRDHPETDLRLMHCVSAYPCPLFEANTQRIALLRQAFGISVGYSDHTGDSLSAVMGLVQGASFFEKHFTFDRTQPGFDHAHAQDATGLAKYIRNVQDAAASLLQPANSLSDKEKVTKIRARRGAYAARSLPAGHRLTLEDILFVRPSTEYSTSDPAKLIGSTLSHDVPAFAALGPSNSVGIVSSNWKHADRYWSSEMEEKGMSRTRLDKPKGAK